MHKFIFTAIFIAMTLFVSSQTQFEPKSLLSPNAASLGEYGSIPVSLYTGTQNISIPIHEIIVGNHKIPITLNYHSGGVRVEQLPGWVGLGWSLNAGGCISRVVNGEVDESCKIVRGDTIKRGYYYHHEYFFIGSTSDSVQLSNRLKDIAGDINGYDVAPDKFSFNFLDYNGVFYMNHQGAWKVLCDKPLRVEFGGREDNFTRKYSETSANFSLEGTDASQKGRTHHFKTFTLIGEDGTRYVFGEDDAAIEYSVDLFAQRTDQLRATTWHLSKIIYPNNREIRFSYEHGPYIAQLYLNDYCKSSKAESGGYECGMGGLVPVDKYSGSLIMPCYLKNITYDYGHLYFEKSDVHDLPYENLRLLCDTYANSSGLTDKSLFMPILANNGVYTSVYRDYPSCLAALKRKKLDRIHVVSSDTSYNAKTIKYIDFEYVDTLTQRLTLNELIIGAESGDGNEAKYQFEYNQIEKIPGYMENKTDHWGFGNGIVSPRVHMGNYESTREPNITISQYGMLTKITYPTGGYNRLEYESHDYKRKVTESRTGIETLDTKKYAGGARIKRIISSPSGLTSDEYIDKEYFYVTDFLANGINSNQSSGILTQLYKYSHTDKKLPTANYLGGFVTIESFGSMSFLPSIGNLSNNHIEYSEVVERNNDGSFTTYEYTNFGDGHADGETIATLFEQPTIYEPKCARDQERGLIKRKTEYSANRIKQKQYLCEYEKSGTDGENHVEIFRTAIGTLCGKLYYEGSAYYAYTYTMRPKTQIETVYEGSDSLNKETLFTYNNWGLVETITTIQSDNTKLRNTYKYPTDFFMDQTAKYNEMRQINRISPIVEEKEEEINENGVLIPLKKTFYHYDTNILRPSSVDMAIGSGDYIPQITYMYDTYGNVINEKPIDGPEVCYIWGYLGTKLLASTYNTPYPLVSSIINTFNHYSTQMTPDLSKLAFIRNHSQCGGMITYNYNILGQLESTIDVTGNKIYYQYDILGRLIAVKDEAGNYIEVYNYNYAH